MKQLLEQRFFRLLSEYSQRKVSVSEFAEAIEELAIHLANFSINEQDYAVLLRYFSFGVNRLKSYRVQFEQGKNAFLLLLDEAIELINNEICIVKWRIKYPVQFQNRENIFLRSPLYLTDETYLVEIMELVSGIFLSERVVTHNGTKSPLTEIGRAFEYLFNIKLGDIHKKHENVICRKANKRTEFLDLLRKAIFEESKKKGYL